MLVHDVMRTPVVTATPDTTLPTAVRAMADLGVRHLPVVDGARLVGIVSDRDLKRAMASSATSLATHELMYLLDRVRLAEIMTRTVTTIAPMFPVEEAARLMVTDRISALPVTEGGRLLGIITETDVLRLFVRALGAGEPSSRLEVAIGADRAAVSDVVATAESMGAPIASVMTLVGPAGGREMIVRVATIDPARVIHALEAKGYKVRPASRG